MLINNINRSVYLFITLSICACSVDANDAPQRSLIKTTRYGGQWKIVYIDGGVQQFDLDKFNARLNEQGITNFSNRPAVFGFGYEKGVNRGVLGFDFHSTWFNDNIDNNLRTSFKVMSGEMTFGANILPVAWSLKLIPTLGVGGGYSTLNIVKKDQDFSTMYSAADSSRSMWQITWLLSAGVGIDYHFALGDKSLVVGLRGGYLYDPSLKNKWNAKGVSVINGPEPLLSGPFARIIIGFGDNSPQSD